MKQNTKKIVGVGILTAIVVALQYLGSFIKLGAFSISLVLIPIVIGAALYGVGAGAWLGLSFGAAVLMSGDASLFLAVNIPGTIIVVLAKGLLAGTAAGLMYKLVEKKNKYAAVITSAIICPLVNTGVFLIGCAIFFMPTIREWATAADLGSSVATYMITMLVGFNFLLELGVNIILSPTIFRLIKIAVKEKV